MRNKPVKANQKIGIWPVLTGMVVWCGIAYIAIFLVLDTVRFKDSDIQLTSSTDSVHRQPDEPDNDAGVAVQDVEAVDSENQSGGAVALLDTWMESTSLASGWYVQMGSYKSKIEAEVERLKYARLQVSVHTEVSHDGLTHLFIGPYQNESTARQASDQIAAELEVTQVAIRKIKATETIVSVGDQPPEPRTEPVPDVELVSQVEDKPDIQPQPEVAPVSEMPSSPDTETDPAVQVVSEMPPKPKVQPIPELTSAPEPQPLIEVEPTPEVSTVSGSWYIQVGAFKEIENARTLGSRIRSNNLPLKIERTDSEFIRVLIGPYPTRENATNLLPEVSKALSLDGAVVRQTEG